MKKIFFFVLLLVATRMNAQQFINGFQLALPDSISNPKAEWVDLDNDGLLDVLVIAQVNTNVYLMSFKSDTVQGFLYQTAINTHYQSAEYHLADYDLDNDIDILLSGSLSGSSATTAWLNESNFIFQSELLVANEGHLVMLSDLDNDGANELVLGGDRISIFKRTATSWNLINDSIAIEVRAIQIFNIDGDPDNDLFVSGRNAMGEPVSLAYINHGNFYFTSQGALPGLDGQLSVGDLNHDGNLDIILSGKDAGSNSLTRILINRQHSFIVKDSVSQLVDAVIFPADFNSDGKCDLQFFGKDLNGSVVNKISFFTSNEEILPVANVTNQRFGDFDKDGDLDLMQVVQGASGLELVYSENTVSQKNRVPNRPVDPVAFQLFDRAFLYWSEAGDDHTPTAAITYDLTIQTTFQEQMIGSFDMLNHNRLTVSNGNTGTRHFAMLKNPGGGGIQFVVQAVDNSFHAGPGGVCVGGATPLCTDLVQQVLQVCAKQTVMLAAEENSLWFSFRDGLIAQGPSLAIDVVAGDTIFAFSPMASSGCALVKLFTVETGTGIIETINTVKYACENQVLEFTAEPTWTNVTWTSHNKGFLSNDHNLTFEVAKADTVKATLSDGKGCSVVRKTTVLISKPELQLNGDVFQVLRGQSIQLSATGGESYSWTPATGLDNPQSSQPIATPLNTTSYQVMTTDSIGCTAEGTVIVMVEGTAFVPNLFTPNNDGRNDEVKVYGLSNVKNFRFTIHNREGSTVYDTNDVHQATSVGWNGSMRGSFLPSGVYYWKVKGEQPSGSRLLLNGKTTGSIVLIR
jgi:gliding motility-associated-like protein